MWLIKSYVSSEQPGELLPSCQARGRLWEGHSDGSHSPPQPASQPGSQPPPHGAHKPPPSQVCGQPSLHELLRSLQPWQDLQFSPFIYTPSPWLHVTSEWCGRAIAADPRVEAVSTDPSLPCWGTRPWSCNTQCNSNSIACHQTNVLQELRNMERLRLCDNVFVYNEIYDNI